MAYHRQSAIQPTNQRRTGWLNLEGNRVDCKAGAGKQTIMRGMDDDSSKKSLVQIPNRTALKKPHQNNNNNINSRAGWSGLAA